MLHGLCSAKTKLSNKEAEAVTKKLLRTMLASTRDFISKHLTTYCNNADLKARFKTILARTIYNEDWDEDVSDHVLCYLVEHGA